ncbi:MAG: amino acid adenylation domain-containing protein, partial [Gammaproteobacteria bacterium]|nr:amino acid adenylation domain-containing protein [Gammaproteobacteria bacterium]
HKYTNEEDIIVGMPVSGRPLKKFESVMGYCINVVGVRSQVNPETRLPEYIKKLQLTLFDALYHSVYPFMRVVHDLKIKRNSNISPLFQISYAYQNFVEESVVDALMSFAKEEFALKTIEGIYQEDNFDLGLDIFEEKENFQLHLKYNPDLYREETVVKMLEHYCNLIETVSRNQQLCIKDYSFISEKECHQILYEFNDTQVDYLKDQTIVNLFEAQVEKTPENIAAVFEGQTLSYRELNTKANQLAHYLMAFDIGAETLVGICVDRSLEMMIGLLGILKAGGAYVPLDPVYPIERLRFMMEESSVDILISQSHLLVRLPVLKEKVVCLDSDIERISACSVGNPLSQIAPDNLAYVLFTSGSTGNPKGVAIEHKSTSALIQWARESSLKEHLSGVLASTSLNFDLSVFELFVPICQGGKIIIVENALSLPTLVCQSSITLINTVPSVIAELSRIQGIPGSVKVINLAGEPLKNELVQSLYQFKTIESIFNLYGPTEDTTYSTFAHIAKGSDRKVHIGCPIDNTQIYILDSNNKMTLPGIPGELCIAGAGLARGYLNRPELTSKSFIEMKIFGKTERIYKTGDMARWLPDGNIECLGRLDEQVKLRGFRIELGEIEVVLRQHDAVKEAVVVMYKEEENPCLIAYVTTERGQNQLNNDERAFTDDNALSTDHNLLLTLLRTWLKDRLPEYMIPSGFVVMEQLPLTPNGKIDRKALPSPALYVQGQKQAPRSETEHLLCSLWSRVLDTDVTSINSHFFEAGGHSLTAIQLVSRIRESFGIEMPLQIVFEKESLREQAEWIDKQQRGAELPPIVPLDENEPRVLSFAQERMWFLAQFEGQSVAYNMPMALHLSGELDEMALQHALSTLIKRHESLRMCFPVVDGEATAQVGEVYDPLCFTDLTDLPRKERQDKVSELVARNGLTPFDLNTGHLLNLRILKIEDQEHIFLFNMHHIISDGWSIGVLMSDLSQLYSAYVKNQQPRLSELPIQYTDYASWQRNWLKDEILEQQLSYWVGKLSGAPELLELPTDYVRPAIMRYRGKRIQNTLNQDITSKIKQLSRDYGVTEFM